MGQNRFAIEAAHNDQESVPLNHLQSHGKAKPAPHTVTLPRKPIEAPELKISIHDETEPHSRDTQIVQVALVVVALSQLLYFTVIRPRLIRRRGNGSS